jgi:hypothetical protein
MGENGCVKEARDELEAMFGALADRLPHHVDDDAESFFLTRETVPQPPDTMATDRFWMRRVGLRFYDNFPHDGLDLCIDKRSSVTLGLLILSVLLHPEPTTVDIELAHPASKIQHLRIRYEQPREITSPYQGGLVTAPAYFAYDASAVQRGPWSNNQPIDPADLPRLQITTEDELGPVGNANFWREFEDRNTVVVESSDKGTARLAQLLLDAGLEDNIEDEFVLGPDWCGIRGTAPMSAVMNIFLPGSIGYDPEDLP